MIAWLILQAAMPSFEAVTAAPASHRVLLEDERVRVLRVTVAPGQTEPVHAHCWPSVMYVEHPQPITYTEYRLEGGRPVVVHRVDAPALPPKQVLSSGPEGLHSITNRGSQPFVALRTEWKSGRCSPEGVAVP